METTVWSVLAACRHAVQAGTATARPPDDKEFHFQRWVGDRILEAGFEIPEGGRNTYPDFAILGSSEAYEVKGITVGSRENDFDGNSALPSGEHDGLNVLYLFGRYATQQVVDIVIAHGAFLNAGGGYKADNKSMRVLGSYGDMLLRDRKMYVAYTPYRLLTNMRDHCSLVLPEAWPSPPDQSWSSVGSVVRVEPDQVLVGYTADLAANTLTPEFEHNPHAGRQHRFQIWRLQDDDDGHRVDLAV